MGEYLKRNGRLLLAAVVIVLFCAALPELFAAGKAIETGSWGLSFREEGKEPVGNASRQALESYDAVYVGDGKEKVIYLTFDAGFENGYTASILDTLQAHNAPACFFVVGNYLETAPELVRRMVNEGHIVGNHTYHHYDMSKISDAASFRKELSDVETLYEQTTGRSCKNTTARRRVFTARKTCAWQSSSAIGRCSGALPMSTGIRTISRRRSRRFPSFFPASIRARWCCCTRHRGQTRKF